MRDEPKRDERERDEPRWRRYLRFYRDDPAADLDDELRDHLESAVEALVARGKTPREARAEALRRFGDVERVRTEVHRLDRRHAAGRARAATLDALGQDLRYGLRLLARSPGFTAVAALSIALGIAANTTVFSAVNALLLRPVPGVRADRLVRVYVNHHSPFDWHDFAWFRERATTFEHLIGERNAPMGMRAGPEPERAMVSFASRGYFGALGVRMALGRPFDGDERSAAGAEPVAVLSHRLWRARFGEDPSVVGRTIALNDRPVTVVGVAPRDFSSSVLGWAPDLWVPLAAAPVLLGRQLEQLGGSLYVSGRLRPGVRPAQAAAELRVLMRQLARTDSARYERRTVRLDHPRGMNAEVRTSVAAASAFLMAVVGLVLLIACANVANLLLGRAATRRTETAVRLAIGASRGRLVRQWITESVLLAGLGGALGFALAALAARALTGLIPSDAGFALDLTPDRRVLAFTALLCMATGVLFGLAPALRAASPDLASALKAEASRAGYRRSRLRTALVGAQAALCVVLLAVASLFLRSLARAQDIDPGFRAAGVLDMPVDVGLRGLGEAEGRVFFRRLLERATALPGVESATLARLVPLGGTNMETRIVPQGMAGSGRFDFPMTYFNVVAPGYFETLGIPLVRGRAFRDADDPAAPLVAVVNETAARRWWPGAEPLGKRLRFGGVDAPEAEVVGVAKDVKYNSLGERTPPFVYVPLAQQYASEVVLQVRTAASPAALRGAMWETVRALDPALPPSPVKTLAADMSLSLVPARAAAGALGLFGLVALLLAATGIYGVTSYAVAQRTRELGIRAALGARRADLLRMVVGESMRVVATGGAVGIALALGAGYAIRGALYGVSPLDPAVVVGVPVVLAAAALVASAIPARRATRADPIAALRAE